MIPAPVSLTTPEGPPFELTHDTRIVATSRDAISVAAWFARLVASAPSRAMPVEILPAASQGAGAPAGAVVFDTTPAESSAPIPYEGYALDVSAAGIRVTATSPNGLFYGAQTLRQLLPASVEYEAARRRTLTVPAVRIHDAPRYAWRGAMLDVARHFFTVDDVRHVIDLLALHKMNRLHLHLSDDQGWRLEMAAWPKLTAVGGSTEVGGGPGGFYTQAEFAEIVRYAAASFIEIIPEFDMPGHTNAALASYPELNCDGIAPPLFTGIRVGFSTLCHDGEATWRLVDDVVREVAAISPSPYVHIGGDEVEQLTAEQYAAFITRAEAIVRRHGKRMIGWDEVAAVTLAPDSIVQVWRPGAPKGDVGQTGAVILSPADRMYLDMRYSPSTPIGLEWAGHIDVRRGYDWEPETLIADLAPEAILGVEAPLWTETVATRADLEFLMLPRLAGVAEIGWSPRARRDWDDYRTRLAAQAPRWTALGLNFYRSPEVPWRVE